jgi:hypothetical protein
VQKHLAVPLLCLSGVVAGPGADGGTGGRVLVNLDLTNAQPAPGELLANPVRLVAFVVVLLAGWLCLSGLFLVARQASGGAAAGHFGLDNAQPAPGEL